MRNTLTALFCVAAIAIPTWGSDTDFEIDLGDGFVTRARLTVPNSDRTNFPTAILFHGSGPSDMDATVSGAAGAPPISANFRRIANRLATRGIATLRFDKRGVRADGTPDWEQIQRSTLFRLIDDAHAVIDAALALDAVDDETVFLYGWDQGAQVVVHAAAARDDIAGLILQGAPSAGWARTFRYEHLDVGLPYLANVVDADGDGALSLTELEALPRAPVTPVGLMPALYLWSSESTPSYPRLRADADVNAEGLLDIEEELRVLIVRQLSGPRPNPFVARDSEPDVLIPKVLRGVDLPVLVLHGEQDGWTSVTDGERIAGAARHRISFRRYPGLGHALDLTTDPALDAFGEMAEQPIQDIADWLLRTLSHRTSLPRVAYDNGQRRLLMSEAMAAALTEQAPDFRPWEADDYPPRFQAPQWYSRWHAPFAAIGDYNGDGVLDLTVLGVTSSQGKALCLLSDGDRLTVMNVDVTPPKLASNADGRHPSPYVVLEAFARGYVAPGHESQPLDLSADAFVVVYIEKSAIIRYLQDGAFARYSLGD
jgi:pimeloyl-ACP methyl ester carboxylesterase